MDKRKAAAAAVAVAAASIVTSASFESPAELMEPVPVVETVDNPDSGDSAPAESERKGPLSKARRVMLRLPRAARAVVGVPLWFAGQGLTAILCALWGGLSALSGPVFTRVFEWVLMAAVALVVFAASVKAALPEVPVKEILRPRNTLPLLGLTAGLAVADAAFSSLTAGQLPRWVWHAGSAGVLAAACGLTIRREKRLLLEAEARKAAEPLSRSALEEQVRRFAERSRARQI